MAVPEPVTLLGVMTPQVRPAGTVSVSETAPENPPTAVMVIVDVVVWPTFADAGDVAVIVKSCATMNVNVAVAVWTREPLVPVIVSTYVPATVAEHETVAVPEPVKVPGVIVPHVNPAGRVSVRVTTPAKPLTAVAVIVEIAD